MQINFGVVLNEAMGDEVKITVIATGFERENLPRIDAQGRAAVAAAPAMIRRRRRRCRSDMQPASECSSAEPALAAEPRWRERGSDEPWPHRPTRSVERASRSRSRCSTIWTSRRSCGDARGWSSSYSRRHLADAARRCGDAARSGARTHRSPARFPAPSARRSPESTGSFASARSECARACRRGLRWCADSAGRSSGASRSKKSARSSITSGSAFS